MGYLENLKKEVDTIKDINTKVPEFPLTDEEKEVLQKVLKEVLLLKGQQLNQSESHIEFVNRGK